MNLLKLSLKNLQSKRYQYIIIGILFFILNICIFTTTYMTKGLNAGIETAKDKLGADIILTSKDDNNKTIESIYDGIPTSAKLTIDYKALKSLDGIEKCCKRLYLATLDGASCCDNKIQLIAIDEDDYLLNALTTQFVESGYIIIGSNVNGEIGQTVTYYGKDFIVADVLEKSGTGYDYSGFISYTDANMIIESNEDKLSEYNINDISAIFITANNPVLVRNVINNCFGKDVSTHLTDNKIAEYTKTVSGIKTIANIVTILLLISSILSIATIMTLMFLNRRNEVGVFVLSGFKKKDIHKIFLLEAVFVILTSMLMSIMIFFMTFSISKSYFEKLLHCPIGSINNAFIIILLLVCSLLFANAVIYTILKSFYKKDPCVLLKEVN